MLLFLTETQNTELLLLFVNSFISAHVFTCVVVTWLGKYHVGWVLISSITTLQSQWMVFMVKD